MSSTIQVNTIKGVRYEVREYNWGRNEYDLIVDGVMILDGKPKDQCIETILEMADDKHNNI